MPTASGIESLYHKDHKWLDQSGVMPTSYHCHSSCIMTQVANVYNFSPQYRSKHSPKIAASSQVVPSL